MLDRGIFRRNVILTSPRLAKLEEQRKVRRSINSLSSRYPLSYNSFDKLREEHPDYLEEISHAARAARDGEIKNHKLNLMLNSYKGKEGDYAEGEEEESVI